MLWIKLVCCIVESFDVLMDIKYPLHVFHKLHLKLGTRNITLRKQPIYLIDFEDIRLFMHWKYKLVNVAIYRFRMIALTDLKVFLVYAMTLFVCWGFHFVRQFENNFRDRASKQESIFWIKYIVLFWKPPIKKAHSLIYSILSK